MRRKHQEEIEALSQQMESDYPMSPPSQYASRPMALLYQTLTPISVPSSSSKLLTVAMRLDLVKTKKKQVLNYFPVNFNHEYDSL